MSSYLASKSAFKVLPMSMACYFKIILTVISCFLQTATIYAKNVEIGGRLQGLSEINSDNKTQDLFLRRTRVNILYRPASNQKVSFDLRNDNANKQDEGDGSFAIGDAYWQLKKLNYKIRFFRAKVDVSYSATSSSKHLFEPNRQSSTDYASNFIVHNRRATNIQINSNYQKLFYQLVISDGIQSGDLEDIQGNTAQEITSQNFSYGGKIRYFLIGSEEKNSIQDTFYGQGNTLSLGIGYFANDRIKYSFDDQEYLISRNLTNIELSYAYKSVRFLSEFFQFNNDLIDIENKVFKNSQAHYIQAEYVIGKIAPYLGYEVFYKSDFKNENRSLTHLVGINYYLENEKMHLGANFKKIETGTAIDNNNEIFSTYLMTDF